MVRVSDIYYAVPALNRQTGAGVTKVNRKGAVSVAQHLIGKAVSKIFKKYFPDPQRKSRPGKEADVTYKTVLDCVYPPETVFHCQTISALKGITKRLMEVDRPDRPG